MIKRRLAASLTALCVLAGLIAILAVRAPAHSAVLNAAPIGNPGMVGMDSRLGRAFILDDGVHAQQVTLDNRGGWSWTNSNSSNKVHVLDTRNGRIIKTLDVPTTVNSMVVDAATDRVFVFDQGQLQVIDARDGTLLNPVTTGAGLDELNGYINQALVDERTGRIFATLDQQNDGASSGQHLLLLDGRTGATLRDLTFPPRPTSVTHTSNGGTSISYGPALSLALDTRAGRLYVFNADRRMSVVDVGSGRILFTRRLPVVLTDAQVDGRSGRIFAFAMSGGPTRLVAGRWQSPIRTLVMLDPRTGALRTITRVTGFDEIAVDEDANRVFVPDTARRAVIVLDGASGRILRTVALGAIPTRLLLDAPHHRAQITTVTGYNPATWDARIAVLDTRAGALPRTLSLPAGQLVYAMSVDTGTGHLVTIYNTMSSGAPDRYAWIPHWLRAHVPWVPPPPPALGPNQRIVTHTALTLDPS